MYGYIIFSRKKKILESFINGLIIFKSNEIVEVKFFRKKKKFKRKRGCENNTYYFIQRTIKFALTTS